MQILRFFGDEKTISKRSRDILELEYLVPLSRSVDALHTALNERPTAIVIDLDVFAEKIESVFFYLSASQVEILNKGVMIVLLTSDREVGTRGLEAGADCFLTKPYHAQELIARIKAIKRRICNGNAGTKISIKDIEIDVEKQTVKKKGMFISLTYTQFKILHFIASRRGGTVCRKEIMEQAWGQKKPPTIRTIDVHVRRLREKLGDTFGSPRYIRTIHKSGYQIVLD